ncbi:hypothetical protein [Bradyrhizobium cenepequi]
MIYSVVGAPPPTSEEISSLLLRSLEVLKPEPNEHYTYILLTLLAPFVIWTSVRLSAGVSLLEKRSGWIGPALIVVAIWLAIPRDPFRASFLDNMRAMPVWLACLVVGACIVAHLTAGKIRIQRIVATLLCGAAAIVTVSWRIFSGNSEANLTNHFEAFFYSVLQTYYGGTCLGDVLPQYGCYAEMLAPVLHLTGFSVLSTTAVMTVLCCISIWATIVFARDIIRSPLILTMVGFWILIAQNRPLWTMGLLPDQYFQYSPIRTLFPALSFLFVHSWQRQRSYSKATLMGAFSALGICWNLDSGIVVSIALFCFVLLSGATSSRFSRNELQSNLVFCSLYVIGALLTITLFVVWLTFKHGQSLQAIDYLAFVRVFYVLGFYMLPMPFPDPWILAIASALLVLVGTAIRIQIGPYSPRIERAAYLALLGVGLFSYFNGRSHPIVFVLVSWPFVLLLGYLIDSWKPVGGELPDRITRGLLAILVIGALLAAVGNLYAGTPGLVAAVTQNWREIFQVNAPTLVERQGEFIRSVIGTSDTLAVLNRRQGALLAQAGRKASLPGPGLEETIRRRDAELQIAALTKLGPQHLFVGKEALEGNQSWGAAAPWILQSMPTIEQAYQVDKWDPDGTLLHLTRRR